MTDQLLSSCISIEDAQLFCAHITEGLAYTLVACDLSAQCYLVYSSCHPDVACPDYEIIENIIVNT